MRSQATRSRQAPSAPFEGSPEANGFAPDTSMMPALRAIAPALCLGLGALVSTLAPVPGRATPPAASSTDARLRQAERIKVTDHAKFVHILAALGTEKRHLSVAQQLHLTELQAWQAGMAGDDTRAIRLYKQVLDRTNDPSTAARARLGLIHIYMVDRHYVKAFALANVLVAHLDTTDDPEQRSRILDQVSQILIRQKQYGEALDYARQMKSMATTARQRCRALALQTQTVLYRGGVLTSSSPAFRHTVDTCLGAGMPGYANAVRLDWASLMDDENHPDRALALLDRIRADVLRAGDHIHIVSLDVTRAQAYLIQHRYDQARASARSALAAYPPDAHNWIMQAAYKVLYLAARQQGRDHEALLMHEKYMQQYQATEDDAKAQAVAFQIVKQDMLARKLKLDELSKRNRILQLNQSLARKSTETNRLYMLLLALALAFIGLWAYRTKHSQLRFRRMSRHDDLTGVFNRKHFLDHAERALRRLGKKGEPACLAILDMDHFKQINDAYGHPAGDVVLRHVVRICQDTVSSTDVIGRLGGEEFGILMPGCHRDEGMQICERIRQTLAQMPAHVPGIVTVTASIGLADSGRHGHQLRPLLIAADRMLYAAKRGGRNRVMAESADEGVRPG